jgi:hypothetical protein
MKEIKPRRRCAGGDASSQDRGASPLSANNGGELSRGEVFEALRARSHGRADQRIQRAAGLTGGDLEHVRVDHGGTDVAVAKQLLHSPDARAALQQVCCEAVAEGVGRDMLLDAGGCCCSLERSSKTLLEEVVSPLNS